MNQYSIKENSWMAKIAAKKMNSERVAIVVGKTIHLHNTTRSQFEADEKWKRHELVHIQQFKRYGFVNFIARYVWQSFLYGYAKNKYEAEARAAENL